MEREYNYQAFTPEEVEQGLAQDLINYLLDHNKKAKEQYYDIHITSDGYCTIIEWTDVNYKFKDEEGRFDFVPSNGYIKLEFSFPDEHYEEFYSKEEYEERLREWHKENPGWVKGPFGTWTNEIENKKFRKQLEGEKE